jgi:hypothetical protein
MKAFYYAAIVILEQRGIGGCQWGYFSAAIFVFEKRTTKTGEGRRANTLSWKQMSAAEKLRSRVQSFINGNYNSMGFILKAIQGNTITIGDEEDDLFKIIVIEPSRFVCFH